jgi:hypothetical protein
MIIVGRIFLIVATLGAAGCNTWPKPTLAYTHAATAKQADERAAEWRELNRGFISYASLTGSMKPYIHGGYREMLLLEPYAGQPLVVGNVVSFDRDPKTPRCLHMIAAVRGDYVYLSGTNNRWSDGWYHRSRISAILREIVTVPALFFGQRHQAFYSSGHQGTAE